MAKRAKSVKAKKSARKIINPEQYRKLTKSELSKIGLSERSERYVKRDLKRITKRTASISKRQYLTGQRGGQTIESFRKARVAGPRTKQFKKTEGGLETWSMPVTEGPFNRRIREIYQRYVERGMANPETPLVRTGYFTFTFGSKGRQTVRTTHPHPLSRMTWANSVQPDLDLTNTRYHADIKKEALSNIDLNVYVV
ncbi:MAG: hypothetical protein P4N59_13180 [Negativicutes bacterium]|nr:hypothetical protein [Negativicutes bacterium]